MEPRTIPCLARHFIPRRCDRSLRYHRSSGSSVCEGAVSRPLRNDLHKTSNVTEARPTIPAPAKRGSVPLELPGTTDTGPHITIAAQLFPRRQRLPQRADPPAQRGIKPVIHPSPGMGFASAWLLPDGRNTRSLPLQEEAVSPSRGRQVNVGRPRRSGGDGRPAAWWRHFTRDMCSAKGARCVRQPARH